MHNLYHIYFLRCQQVNIDSFFQFVPNNPENEQLYPTLWRIIHAEPLFWCLKYLPEIATWLRLITITMTVTTAATSRRRTTATSKINENLK